MSLWTPSGEHPVGRDKQPQAPQSSTPSQAPPGGPGGPAPGEPDGPSLDDLTPEQRAQVEEMARQMEEAQAHMLRMPAEAVVGQQAVQFYDLAVVYLSQKPPRLDDARLAIDALVAVTERLGTRLGQAEPALRQATNDIQLAFVQIADGKQPQEGD